MRGGARPVVRGRDRYYRLRDIYPAPSPQVESEARAIANAAREALEAASLPIPWISDRYVHARIIHHTRSKECTLEIWPGDEIPEKGYKGTKQDVHGIPEAVFDAIEGSLCANDRQVSSLSIERRFD